MDTKNPRQTWLTDADGWVPSYHRWNNGSTGEIVIKFAIKKGSSSPLRQDPSPIETKQMRATGVAAGLGCSIVATVVICIIGGIFLDRELGTEPWLTLAGVGIAIVAAGYQLYELSTLGRTGSKPGVLSRNIERIVPARGDRAETSEIGTGRSETGSHDQE
jgi:ATP synthase protein I